MKWLRGSAGLCVCRPCPACYFLEVIRPTLPHQEKALMISGSHEICTAGRSLASRSLASAPSSPPFTPAAVLSRYLISSFLASFHCGIAFLNHFPDTSSPCLSSSAGLNVFVLTPFIRQLLLTYFGPFISVLFPEM